jgi:hypothetical protein
MQAPLFLQHDPETKSNRAICSWGWTTGPESPGYLTLPTPSELIVGRLNLFLRVIGYSPR